MSSNYMKCPFCGYEVEHGLTVCRGCQAEIYYPNESAFDNVFKYIYLAGVVAFSSFCLILTIIGTIKGTSSITELILLVFGLIFIGVFVWKAYFVKRKPEFRRTFRER